MLFSATISGISPGTSRSSATTASRARSARMSQQLAMTCPGLKGSGVISKLSVSIFDMSRMPLTTDSR
jgi:hypothetical protein